MCENCVCARDFECICCESLLARTKVVLVSLFEPTRAPVIFIGGERDRESEFVKPEAAEEDIKFIFVRITTRDRGS